MKNISVELFTKRIPKFVSKYEDLVNKGLFWEMIKMEIRATTISFSKGKAKQKQDEEKELLQQFSNLQEQLRSNFKDTIKTEMDRVKNKLKKIIAPREQCSVTKLDGTNSAKKTANNSMTWRKEIIRKNK